VGGGDPLGLHSVRDHHRHGDTAGHILGERQLLDQRQHFFKKPTHNKVLAVKRFPVKSIPTQHEQSFIFLSSKYL